MSELKTEESYYRFLKPKKMLPRKPETFVGKARAIEGILWATQQEPQIVHYDLETSGLQYYDPEHFITNVGLATEDWVIGIDLVDLSQEEVQPLWDWLAKCEVGGFNLSFDLAWPWRERQPDNRVKQNFEDIRVSCDTSLWFRLLATEAHFGQKFSLEELTTRVLLWPEKYQQKGWLRENLDKYKFKKDQMMQLAVLEPAGYTLYCALDAEASYQASVYFHDIVKELGFDHLRRYHDNILVPKIKRQINASCYGVPVSKELVERNLEWANQRIWELEYAAMSHPEIAPHIDEFTQLRCDKQYTLRANLKKQWAKKSDEPWLYPDVYRLSPTDPDKLPKWLKPYGGKFYRPETQFRITGESVEWPKFNFGSPMDMHWLIYTKWIKGKYKVWHRNPERKDWGGILTLYIGGKPYELELTKAGGLPTGGDILTLFGEAGKLVSELKTTQKMRSDFMEKYYDASRRTGYIHATSKILGSVNGRMSGG